ncbi:hypothetical protein BJX66DRAFT_191437 [Aspergillus keveii]|uniref:Uncharacterized protein n=1 Tax=Aspergillus keveii TaxID=714993 RepID=A0ABR4G6P8_9EURO
MLEYGEPIVEDVLSHHAMCGHSTAPINRHMSVEKTWHARAARSLRSPGVMSALFITPIWYQVLLMSGAQCAGCLLYGGRLSGVPSSRAMGQTGDRRQVSPGKSKKKDEFQKKQRETDGDSTFLAVPFFGKTYVVIATLFTLHHPGSSGAGLVEWQIIHIAQVIIDVLLFRTLAQRQQFKRSNDEENFTDQTLG